MTDDTPGVDGFRPSPSEALYGWARAQRLHPVTWIMILAALLHLAGDVVLAIVDLAKFIDRAGIRQQPLAEVLADIAHMLGYSLALFGTAASVEFLFRIWGELRMKREFGRTSD